MRNNLFIIQKQTKIWQRKSSLVVVGSCKSTIRNMSDDAQFWLSLSQRAIAQRVKTENTIVSITKVHFTGGWTWKFKIKGLMHCVLACLVLWQSSYNTLCIEFNFKFCQTNLLILLLIYWSGKSSTVWWPIWCYVSST